MYPLQPTDTDHVVAFETEALSGVICSQGETHGFRELVMKPSGARPNNPRLYLGHVYRLLADGRYLMTARDHPHQGTIAEDRVTVRWEPLEVHPASIEAVYQVSGENTLDMTVTVELTQAMERYELYLSNYFSPAFRPYVYLQPAPYLKSTEPALYAPRVNDFIQGYYLAYPRDKEALRTLFDGRWHGDHPVQFCVGKYYHAPIGIYASVLERQAVVVTARRDECFSLYGTYDSPDARDNILHHNSLYFAMFNEDLQPGDRRTAHLRYHFVTWNTVDDLPLKLHEAFEQETA